MERIFRYWPLGAVFPRVIPGLSSLGSGSGGFGALLAGDGEFQPMQAALVHTRDSGRKDSELLTVMGADKYVYCLLCA